MNLDWKTLNNLEKEYGDYFYILDMRKFADNYQDFLQCFRSIYANSNIGYSYKTNYTPQLCHQVNNMGGYAEVVSQMEYDLAISIGVSPSRIIYNGPIKHNQNIEKAILAGSIVNLDSLQEVEIVAALARRFPEHKIAVGLRCNFDIGESNISRFGLDVEAGEIDYAFKSFAELNNCFIEGLHCHFSTPHRSAESYSLRTKNILELSDYYFQDKLPRFIDVGGGFFGSMNEELMQQYGCHIPSYQEYAEAIATHFRGRFSQENSPELILEPGIALVADVMNFVGKVVGLKTVRSRKIALLMGSIHNIKPTLNNKKLPFTVYANDEDEYQNKLSGAVDLAGYTCIENDYLSYEFLGEIGIGDYVVFDNIGAYTIVLKPPFICPAPPIISYDSLTNEYAMIRRQETVEDVFSTYVI
ncbi:putative diaminopimelate decarboxylase [Cylindrospermum sp. NIES-4074]|nr:putative diaminopimelate decarboxylase [Cylindrospermum sp. NIES-4074]